MADGRGEEVDWTTGEITIIFLSLSPSCSTTIDYVTVTCSKSLRPQQEQQQEMLELVKKNTQLINESLLAEWWKHLF